MTLAARSEAFWHGYLATLADPAQAQARFYEAFRIGDSAESACVGAALILAGRKTATSALLLEYEAAGKAPPVAGALSIVEDGDGAPVCVVETREVLVQPLACVDERLARDYGEWDGTLATWRRECGEYYLAVCQRLGRPYDEQLLLVCERFHVVFPVTAGR